MKRFAAGSWVFAALFAVALFAAKAEAAETVTDLEIGIDAGCRVDELNWNIAGGGVDVLSELEWEDLTIYQLRAAGSLTLERADFPHFATFLRGSAGYGWIVDGDNRDSDYAGSGRTLEFSRSENGADDGDVLDLSIAIGPQFSLRGGTVLLTPLFGLSYHEQNLTINDGFQTVSDQSLADAFFGPGEIILPPVGPIAGLDSSYETAWSGPWLGLDAQWKPDVRFTLAASAEYHWADYEAEAVWNLRDTGVDPWAQDPSFEHEADGSGVVLALTVVYAWSERWSMDLSADYRDWETDAGIHRLFFADGRVAETRLNEVHWESSSVNLGVRYRFF